VERAPTSGSGSRGGCTWDSRLMATRLNIERICSGIRITYRRFSSRNFNRIFENN